MERVRVFGGGSGVRAFLFVRYETVEALAPRSCRVRLKLLAGVLPRPLPEDGLGTSEKWRAAVTSRKREDVRSAECVYDASRHGTGVDCVPRQRVCVFPCGRVKGSVHIRGTSGSFKSVICLVCGRASEVESPPFNYQFLITPVLHTTADHSRLEHPIRFCVPAMLLRCPLSPLSLSPKAATDPRVETSFPLFPFFLGRPSNRNLSYPPTHWSYLQQTLQPCHRF